MYKEKKIYKINGKRNDMKKFLSHDNSYNLVFKADFLYSERRWSRETSSSPRPSKELACVLTIRKVAWNIANFRVSRVPSQITLSCAWAESEGLYKREDGGRQTSAISSIYPWNDERAAYRDKLGTLWSYFESPTSSNGPPIQKKKKKLAKKDNPLVMCRGRNLVPGCRYVLWEFLVF